MPEGLLSEEKWRRVLCTISRDTFHEKGVVRNEYDGGTEKGEEVMLGIDLQIQIQRAWLEIAIKTA